MGTILKKIRSNYMVHTFFSIRGNARACIWTEPLWGIPYNLYIPYVTLFMTSLGLDYFQIGVITSISVVSQVISSLLSGVITDKLGRRWATVIFDTLSWSVPEVLWAFSQNFAWFAVAALFNGMWRVTENSWNLLLVEDTPREQIVPLFALTQLMGLLVAFVTPLSKFAIEAFGVVRFMRFMYGFTAVSMTVKFLLLHAVSHETEIGKRRMEQTRHIPMWKMVWQCKDVYLRIIREKRMRCTLAIMACFMLINATNSNYFAIYICERLGVRQSDVSLFATLKSMATLMCIFLLVPKLKKMTFRKPMLICWGIFALSQGLLMLNPGGKAMAPMLVLNVLMEAAALSVLNPMTSSLLFINANSDERALICGLVYATIALIVAIFPAFVGLLANVSLLLPFASNLFLFVVAAAMTVAISRLPSPDGYENAA